ncbi:MAG: PHP domain-containing protein, partial [Usitatibacter sp.]
MIPGYAELHCLSNYTFLRGASDPEELVERAMELGYSAIAITDECSVSGVVRAYSAAKDAGLKLIIGAEFTLIEGMRLVLLVRNIRGYEILCELITRARRAAPKGEYKLAREDLPQSPEGLLAIGLPGKLVSDTTSGETASKIVSDTSFLSQRFPGAAYLGIELHRGADDNRRIEAIEAIARQSGLPCVAAGDVHMHIRARKKLQDVMTAIRLKTTLAEAGKGLQPNSERYLRSIGRLSAIYPARLLATTLDVASRCTFSLDEIRYEYPEELVPPGQTPTTHLRRLTQEGIAQRYKGDPPASVLRTVEHELKLIEELKYEPFFLTVHDIVAFARQEKILCQGRGSAANSAVCYCLGITEVDPGRMSVLFERFISRERNEPPDIDVDFEHQRREEVIQYIYAKYGRDRAAIAAVVICYRSRSALRDVGKAMGVDERLVDEFAKDHYWFDQTVLVDRLEEAMARAGVRESLTKLQLWLELTNKLKGFPRHLSQHVGGFVLTQTKLTRLVPVEKASMADRSVIQWEKDDLEAMGMLKVDVLALGMLSAIQRGLGFMNRWRGTSVQMHQIPNDDAKVYDMICAADTIGVFQIESRAQMSMLPRLQPRRYYDLVVEVAIVRPGPIQGGMVHPYLKNREKLRRGEQIEYRYPALKEALGRTLGVPI